MHRSGIYARRDRANDTPVARSSLLTTRVSAIFGTTPVTSFPATTRPVMLLRSARETVSGLLNGMKNDDLHSQAIWGENFAIGGAVFSLEIGDGSWTPGI